MTPSKFDEVVYVRDSDGDVIQYVFYFQAVQTGYIDVTYDVNKDTASYKGTIL